jgi:hypothetical protein
MKTKRLNFIVILVFILLFSCTEKKTKNIQRKTIGNSTFEYSMKNSRLNDTLKQYSIQNQLKLLQVWENGKLISTCYIDYLGNPRKLKYHEYWEENTVTQYYYDINDREYTIIPYDNDTYTFFKEVFSASTSILYKDSLNCIDFFNCPKEIMALSVKRKIKWENNCIKFPPSAERDDTLSFYLNIGDGKPGKLDMIIK